MAKPEDLRKLKDQATKAIEKRSYAKAAELYAEIAEREPDPDWHHRAGEAFRRADDGPRAIEALTKAADGYGRGGFLLKAIAVCKSILQVDPTQTAMQARLAELYARRDGSGAAPGAPAAEPTAAPTVLQPPPKPEPKPEPAVAVSAAEPADLPPPGSISARPAPPMLRPPSVQAALDQITAVRPDSPIDALPLRHVLGGRRSETISIADVMEIAAEAEVEMPGAYEIELDAEPLEIELVAAPSTPAPAPAPIALSDETDFGGLRDEAPASAPAPTLRVDELDFGGLMDDPPAPAAPKPEPAPPPSAPLPSIPLFSSLGEADLRFFIERMTLGQRQPGEVIVHKGDRGGSLYVLVDGEVTVTSDGAQLARLGPGAFFGEVGVLTDEPRTATIEAASECTTLEVSRELLWELVRRSPEVLRTLLRFLRDRLLERLLGSSALFSSLSPDDARGLASQFVFLELEAGVRAVEQGKRAPGLFFLLSGAAEAVRDGAVLGALGPGDVFGEISLLLRTPASADVRAVSKCWALSFPQARFQEIMLTYPQVLAYVSELGEARRSQNATPEAETRDGRVDLA